MRSPLPVPALAPLLALAACAGEPPASTGVAPDLGLAATAADPGGGLCVAAQLDRWDAARRQAQVEALVRLGVRTLRQDLLWSRVQPERDAWEWETEDAIVDAAVEAGIEVIPMLGYGTEWAASFDGATDASPPDDPADFAAFAGAAAARYADRVRRFEVWNEPNVGFRFWQLEDPLDLFGDPTAYGALFVAAAEAIRAAHPAAEVIVAGTFWHPQVVPGSVEFLSEAAATVPGFLEAADAVAVHPYTLYPPRVGPESAEGDERPLWEMLAELRTVTGDLPLLITEVGWPSYGEVDEAEQAAFLVREFALAHASGVRDVCWFTLEDGEDPASDPEQAFGLYRAGAVEAKPAADAYGALAQALQGIEAAHGRAEEALGASEGVYAVRYAAADAALTALWTVESEVAVQVPALATACGEAPAAQGTAGPAPWLALQRPEGCADP